MGMQASTRSHSSDFDHIPGRLSNVVPNIPEPHLPALHHQVVRLRVAMQDAAVVDEGQRLQCRCVLLTNGHTISRSVQRR